MQYLVRCECGRQLVVTEGVPGMTITCACGRELHLADARRGVFPDDADPAGGEPTVPDFVRTLYTLTPRCYATVTLFGLNIAAYLIMVLFGVDPVSPSAKDLIPWGACFGPLVWQGEYWRLLACTFLHFGIIHIACNMWGLWNIGFLVERFVGTVGFVILYFISGLVGSVATLFWSPYSVGAGASGALFGLVGALFGFVMLRQDTVPERIRRSLRSSAVSFAVINLLISFTVPNIGVAAHLGGLAAGFCCGLAMSQPITLRACARRPLRNVLVAAGGALVIAGAFLLLPPPAVDVRIEFELVLDHQKKAIDIFNKAQKQADDGTITQAELANVVENEALPEWRKMTGPINALKNVPEGQKPIYDLMCDYLNSRQRGWELLAEGIRDDDPAKLQQAKAEEKRANTAVKKLNEKLK